MLLITFLLVITISYAFGAPEQGKFSATISSKGNPGYVSFTKTLYSGSKVKLFIPSSSCVPPDSTLVVTWLVRSTSCYGEYTGAAGNEHALSVIMDTPSLSHPYGSGYYIKHEEKEKCGKFTFTDNSSQNWIAYSKQTETTAIAKSPITTVSSSRERRNEAPLQDVRLTRRTKRYTESRNQNSSEIDDMGTEQADLGDIKKSRIDEATTSKPHAEVHVIAVTQHEAPYILIVEVRNDAITTKTFDVKIAAEMETPLGYLSAHEYPLLTFYMVMCIVYSIYAVVWLVMSACNFRDLLRVQFWIGGVILLGMIEKAVFYSEYLSVNSIGESVTGASKFAEVVSAMKRALARMLVIIVSLGFGIVKPRLGPMLHRVIGIGILYFILAVIEALVRTNSPIRDPSSNNTIFASIPLAIVDSIICWWIFMSLMQTMKTLRLRRNVVKLSLYRHFSNTIIFCVIASLAMIFYSLRYRDQCMSDWSELWVDDAFWHILFSAILLVIMILWRPNINNQRYSFSPLIDGEVDEESEEPILAGSGATETVKMRGLRNTSDYDHASKTEDDLKWIEENIPQTIADAALPAIMDSDEEIMTTKYEISKME